MRFDGSHFVLAGVILVMLGLWFSSSTKSQVISRAVPRNQWNVFVDVLARALRNEYFKERALSWCDEAYAKDKCNSSKKCKRHVGATMTGLHHLINFAAHIKTAVERGVAGDVIECGTWQGGNSIMAAVVLQFLDEARMVWLADSFEGHPKYTGRDSSFAFTEGCSYYAAPLEWVQKHLRRFGVEHNTKVLKGWFKDTLAKLDELQQISVLRMDADAYSSTTLILDGLYDKVSPGGIIIIDDWYAYAETRDAIADFRKKRGIKDKMYTPPEAVLESNARVYWVKGSSTLETSGLLTKNDIEVRD